MTKYFLNRNGQKSGPYTLDTLKELKIKKKDLIYKEGTEDWVTALTLEELSPIIEIEYELPPTPFEKESKKIKNSFAQYIWAPVVFGLLLGLLSIFLWSNTKSTIYKEENNVVHNYTDNRSYGTDKYVKYVKGQNKYANGKFGYNSYQSISDNEDFYYESTKSDFFRPLKSLFIIFNSNAQFYVGRTESTPFISFLLIWVIYCFIIYFIAFGIYFLIKASKNAAT